MYVYEEDFQLNIHLVYEWVRQIADWIFIQCMQDSAGLLTGYSFSVCRGQAEYWPDIHSAYGISQADFWLNIHLVYAGIWRITDRIFINLARWIRILNSRNWIFNSWNDWNMRIRILNSWNDWNTWIRIFNSRNNQIRWIRIEYSIVEMVRLSRLQLNIQ